MLTLKENERMMHSTSLCIFFFFAASCESNDFKIKVFKNFVCVGVIVFIYPIHYAKCQPCLSPGSSLCVGYSLLGCEKSIKDEV